MEVDDDEDGKGEAEMEVDDDDDGKGEAEIEVEDEDGEGEADDNEGKVEEVKENEDGEDEVYHKGESEDESGEESGEEGEEEVKEPSQSREQQTHHQSRNEQHHLKKGKAKDVGWVEQRGTKQYPIYVDLEGDVSNFLNCFLFDINNFQPDIPNTLLDNVDDQVKVCVP